MTVDDSFHTAAVLGGGSYGTALAQLLARKGASVKLQVRESKHRDTVNVLHENPTYLPGIKLSERIVAVESVQGAVEGAQLILIVIPTAFFRSFVRAHRDEFPVGVPIVVCAKGIENDTLCTPFEILEEELPGKYHKFLAALSGPSFAKEVAENRPSSVTVAARSMDLAKKVQYMVSDSHFRAYRTTDVIGIEICGAVKNVYAIATGGVDGAGLGLNTRAALITRGLAETTRLAAMRGANPMTIMGLAGVGDLVLTCTGSLSRNWNVGNRLAKGESLEEVLGSSSMVAEGVNTALSLHQMCEKHNLNMPIATEIYKVLYEKKSFMEALQDLLNRPLCEEISEVLKADSYKAANSHGGPCHGHGHTGMADPHC